MLNLPVDPHRRSGLHRQRTPRAVATRAGSPRVWLACILAALLLGCGATGKPKPRDAERVGSREAVAKPRRKAPRPEDCGPVLDPKVWKIQCSNATLAMTCRRSDPTDRRCASRQGGKLRWTYGSFCDGALPCYRKACPP